MSGMSKKTIVTILTVLGTAAGAFAAEEVVDGFESGQKTKSAVVWMSILLTVVFLLSAMAIAFKDSRRRHVD